MKTDDHARLTHHRTVFDGWRSISIALYLSLVGYGVLVGMLAGGINNTNILISMFSFNFFMYLRLRVTIPALADAP